jgi:hypothetical protein
MMLLFPEIHRLLVLQPTLVEQYVNEVGVGQVLVPLAKRMMARTGDGGTSRAYSAQISGACCCTDLGGREKK